ncbi:hypothetical protein K435DRAFT_839104, partial [Dendrothele bispora CBS 962.96]
MCTLTTAWGTAANYLAWSAGADTPPETVRNVSQAFTRHITCIQEQDHVLNRSSDSGARYSCLKFPSLSM